MAMSTLQCQVNTDCEGKHATSKLPALNRGVEMIWFVSHMHSIELLDVMSRERVEVHELVATVPILP